MNKPRLNQKAIAYALMPLLLAGCFNIIGGDRSPLSLIALSGGFSGPGASFLGTFWNAGARWVEMDGSHIFELNNSWFNTSGLVGYWNYNAAPIADGSLVADSSGQGNSGTLRTGQPGVSKSVAGKLGSAITFDGTNDGIDVNDNASLRPAQLSISAWVNHNTFAAGTVCGAGDPNIRVLLFKRNTRTTTAIDAFGLYGNTSGQFEFAVSNAAGTRTSTGFGGASQIGQWSHVVATFSRPTMKLFVNGVLERTATHNFDLDYDTRPLFMGRTGECGGAGEANTDAFFNGAMDEVSVWNRELSDQEVALMYERQSSRFTGTYTSSIYDAGGNANWSSIRPIPESPYEKEIHLAAENAYGSGIVDTTGLVAHYQMNNATGPSGFLPGGTVIPDSSGLNNNASVFLGNKFRYIKGKFSEAIWSEDGLNDVRINPAPSLNNLPALTVSLWAKVYVRGTYFAKRDNGTGAGWALTQLLDGRIYFIAGHATQNLERISFNLAKRGEWQHVVVTWNGQPALSNVRFYLDGAETGYSSPGGFDGIGARLDDSPEWASFSSDQGVGGMTGALDDVAVFNRVLSLAEIQTLYQRGAARLKYQVRSCGNPTCSGSSFIGPDGSPYSHYSEAMSNSAGLPVFNLTNVPGNRYFQFRAYFESDDAVLTPKLKDLTVDASR